jgi:hypothetical protein
MHSFQIEDLFTTYSFMKTPKSLVKSALEIEPKMSIYIRCSVPKENKIAYIEKLSNLRNEPNLEF